MRKVYDPPMGIELMHEIDMDEATVGTRKGPAEKPSLWNT